LAGAATLAVTQSVPYGLAVFLAVPVLLTLAEARVERRDPALAAAGSLTAFAVSAVTLAVVFGLVVQAVSRAS
jgi:hypothetical protein